MKTKLVVVGGRATQREVTLQLPASIGREREAALTVLHPTVSRKHCELIERDGQVVVRDLGSTNGTFINNERITEAVLAPGVRFTVGPLTFAAEYELVNGAGAHVPAGSPNTEPLDEKLDEIVNEIDTAAAGAATIALPPASGAGDDDLGLADDDDLGFAIDVDEGLSSSEAASVNDVVSPPTPEAAAALGPAPDELALAPEVAADSDSIFEGSPPDELALDWDADDALSSPEEVKADSSPEISDSAEILLQDVANEDEIVADADSEFELDLNLADDDELGLAPDVAESPVAESAASEPPSLAADDEDLGFLLEDSSPGNLGESGAALESPAEATPSAADEFLLNFDDEDSHELSAGLAQVEPTVESEPPAAGEPELALDEDEFALGMAPLDEDSSELSLAAPQEELSLEELPSDELSLEAAPSDTEPPLAAPAGLDADDEFLLEDRTPARTGESPSGLSLEEELKLFDPESAGDPVDESLDELFDGGLSSHEPDSNFPIVNEEEPSSDSPPLSLSAADEHDNELEDFLLNTASTEVTKPDILPPDADDEAAFESLSLDSDPADELAIEDLPLGDAPAAVVDEEPLPLDSAEPSAAWDLDFDEPNATDDQDAPANLPADSPAAGLTVEADEELDFLSFDDASPAPPVDIEMEFEDALQATAEPSPPAENEFFLDLGPGAAPSASSFNLDVAPDREPLEGASPGNAGVEDAPLDDAGLNDVGLDKDAGLDELGELDFGNDQPSIESSLTDTVPLAPDQGVADTTVQSKAPPADAATAPAKAKRGWWPFGGKKKDKPAKSKSGKEKTVAAETPNPVDEALTKTELNLAETVVFKPEGESVADVAPFDAPPTADAPELDALDSLSAHEIEALNDLVEPRIIDSFELDEPADNLGFDLPESDDPLAALEAKEAGLAGDAVLSDLDIAQTVEFVPAEIVPDAAETNAANAATEPAKKSGFRWWPFGRKSGDGAKPAKPPKAKKEKPPKTKKEKKGKDQPAEPPAAAPPVSPVAAIEPDEELLDLDFGTETEDYSPAAQDANFSEENALDFLSDAGIDDATAPPNGKTPDKSGKPASISDIDLDEFLKDI